MPTIPTPTPIATATATATATHSTSTPLIELLELATTSQNAATHRTVILKALSDTDIFCGFDELSAICSPVLKETSEGDVLLKTLELFSYGTMNDYTTAPSGTYLTLSDLQRYKLRQLTILEAVQRSCYQWHTVLPYADITDLQQSTIDEAMIVSCIYAGLFQGKLCQTTQTLTLDPTSNIRARDVATLPIGLSAFQELYQTLDETIASLQLTKMTVVAQNQSGDLEVGTKSYKSAVALARSLLDNVLENAYTEAGQKNNKRTRGDATIGRL